jgi:hypothetical protein
VRYLYDSSPRSLTIPAGHESAAVAAPPGEAERVVVTIAADPAHYRIGCPIAALVARVDGPAPVPVDIARIDPNGGVSDEIHKIGDANMRDHKKDKSIKHKTLYPPQ